jgi:hypothetical protein
VWLVNNLVFANGTASGSTGGRFGVKREDSTSPQPAGITLQNNLICGNRLGEIDGPALDATDSNNLTPTGSEGPGSVRVLGVRSPRTSSRTSTALMASPIQPMTISRWRRAPPRSTGDWTPGPSASILPSTPSSRQTTRGPPSGPRTAVAMAPLSSTWGPGSCCRPIGPRGQRRVGPDRECGDPGYRQWQHQL